MDCQADFPEVPLAFHDLEFLLGFLVHYHVVFLAGDHLVDFLVGVLGFDLLHGLKYEALDFEAVQGEH